MDKEIRKIKKSSQKETKALGKLEKMDIKRDKKCDQKKMMKKKSK